MYTYQQKCTMNLGDSYTLLYGFIAGTLMERLGMDGETAVREATRQLDTTGRRLPENATRR